MHKNFSCGALPPAQFAWQAGKTAASIAFVGQAEAILAQSRLSPTTAQNLRDRVERVKRGEEAVDRHMTDDEVVVGSV